MRPSLPLGACDQRSEWSLINSRTLIEPQWRLVGLESMAIIQTPKTLCQPDQMHHIAADNAHLCVDRARPEPFPGAKNHRV